MSLRPLRLLAFLCAILTAMMLVGSLAPSLLAQDPIPSGQDTTTVPLSAQQPEAAQQEAGGFMATIDAAVGRVNAVISAFFFADVLFWDDEHVLPLAVFWLVLGAIFLTVRMGFINFRAFKHAIKVTSGKYDDPNDR
jgi:hypothetical protein